MRDGLLRNGDFRALWCAVGRGADDAPKLVLADWLIENADLPGAPDLEAGLRWCVKRDKWPDFAVNWTATGISRYNFLAWYAIGSAYSLEFNGKWRGERHILADEFRGVRVAMKKPHSYPHGQIRSWSAVTLVAGVGKMLARDARRSAVAG